jgi:hypothetical protein
VLRANLAERGLWGRGGAQLLNEGAQEELFVQSGGLDESDLRR